MYKILFIENEEIIKDVDLKNKEYDFLVALGIDELKEQLEQRNSNKLSIVLTTETEEYYNNYFESNIKSLLGVELLDEIHFQSKEGIINQYFI